ncbi:hypothetical protein FOA52_011418 [Chlamydomonas sp. UWO 241]|nr:hypothetical protein FOA52_011418 [Chlamydomonas sp. UWO 241]
MVMGNGVASLAMAWYFMFPSTIYMIRLVRGVQDVCGLARFGVHFKVLTCAIMLVCGFQFAAWGIGASISKTKTKTNTKTWQAVIFAVMKKSLIATLTTLLSKTTIHISPFVAFRNFPFCTACVRVVLSRGYIGFLLLELALEFYVKSFLESAKLVKESCAVLTRDGTFRAKVPLMSCILRLITNFILRATTPRSSCPSPRRCGAGRGGEGQDRAQVVWRRQRRKGRWLLTWGV